MLGPDSFLNNLPVALEPKTRLAFEAIGFSLHSMAYSYEQLKTCGIKLANAPRDTLPKYDVVPLFVHAWAVVDSTHLARKLVLATNPKNVRLQDFIRDTEPATKLRNKLHHIHGNLKNLSERGDSPPPLFGGLSFLVTEPRHLTTDANGAVTANGWRGISLNSGRPVKTTFHAGGDPMATPFESPVGLFQLHAFDQLTNLSALRDAGLRVADVFEEDVKPKVHAAVREASIKAGADPEEQLRTTGVGIIMEMEVSAVPDDEDRPVSG